MEGRGQLGSYGHSPGERQGGYRAGMVGSERCLSWREVKSREGFQVLRGSEPGFLGGGKCFAMTFSEEARRKVRFDGKKTRWFPTILPEFEEPKIDDLQLCLEKTLETDLRVVYQILVITTFNQFC